MVVPVTVGKGIDPSTSVGSVEAADLDVDVDVVAGIDAAAALSIEIASISLDCMSIISLC